MSSVKSYRDLIVWQKGMKLAAMTYRLAKLMPRQEEYRLTNQMLRAAASIPANIAEGHMRGSRKDYARFISIARGSLAELETFQTLAVDVELLKADQVHEALALADEVDRMLNALRLRLDETRSNGFSEDETGHFDTHP